jgi:serine/threonine-protein kinase
MDFGIARSLEAKEMTIPGAIIGTPHYMSPEQAEGKKADARSDIYSLGCILYEMLTRKPPFDAPTTTALMHKHIRKKPQLPSKLNPQIPPNLEKIILKCLEKKPEKRHQSADRIIKSIEETKAELISAIKPAKIRWKLYVPIAAIILIGLAIGFYFLMRKEKQPAPTPPAQTEWKNSIAVLPFEDLSPQKDQEYFCDGMTEEIIGKLSKLGELKVIARTSVMLYKDTKKNIKDIGQELGVVTILEGSVRKEKDNIRISAQLINVEDGFHIWADAYDRKLESVFAIQDEISLKIADALKIELRSEEKNLLAKHYTEDIEAYNLYLKGRYYWNKWTVEGGIKGLEYFQQALDKDPIFAMAYSGISDCYSLFVWYGYQSPKDSFLKAKAAAEKALEIDNTLAEAHASLAEVTYAYDYDWSAAEREFKCAIKLKPNYSEAHWLYARYLRNKGKHRESIAEAKRALQLDPLSISKNFIVALAFHWARQYDRAIEEYKKTLEMYPNYRTARWYLASAYTEKGMYKEAIEEVHKGYGIKTKNALLGYIYAVSGKKDEAKKMLDERLKLRRGWSGPYLTAMICVGLGRNDEAFEWLERSYEEREGRICWIKVDPRFDPLRSDPRYKALLKKMNLE